VVDVLILPRAADRQELPVVRKRHAEHAADRVLPLYWGPSIHEGVSTAASCFPAIASQTTTCPTLSAVARNLPSGENARHTASTGNGSASAADDGQDVDDSPVSAFQILQSMSSETLAMNGRRARPLRRGPILA